MWFPINKKENAKMYGDVLFTDGQNIYCGKINFDDTWIDHQLGPVKEILFWSNDVPSPPSFISKRPLNDDYKGWEHIVAPLADVYVWVTNADSKLNIAKFSSGWFDRKGNKLDDVLCSYPMPEIPKNI